MQDSLAKRMRVSRSELFCAVEAYIEAHQHDRVRETLDTVKESSDVDEALAEMQAASVAREDG